jgi:hypothetical protein
VTLWVDERETASLPFDAERSARFDDDRQDFGGQALQFRVKLAMGDHHIAAAIPRIYEGLPASYHGPNPSPRPEAPRKAFTPPANASAERIVQLRKSFDEREAELQKIPLNGVRIGTVDVGGPYDQVTGPSRQSTALIYACGHRSGQHTAACTPKIVTSLAERAFRRPVAADEVAKYVALARRAEQDEGSFEEGLAVAIQALLVSPDFLFRLEHDRPAVPPRPAGASRSTSWRRGCRTSSGEACPMRRCGGPPMPGRCAIPACWPPRCGACFAIRAHARSRSSSAASGSSFARSSR